jgi:hypothetical protein
MNSSNASSYYYYTLDALFTAYGSTWILDNLNLYPFVIVGILGALLNLFAFIIFLDREFSITLYNYLRVYTLNNTIMCLISISNFFWDTYRILPWSNSYWTQVWLNFVYTPISNVSYFYSSLLDICILLDRIATFNSFVRSCMTLPCRFVCLITLLVTLVIDLPYFFVFVPAYNVSKLNATTEITIWFSSTSSFATSTAGTVVTFVVYALRDVLVMVIQIVLNIVSVLLLREHLQNKLKLTSGPFGLTGVNNPTALNQQTSTLANQATTTRGIVPTTAGGDVAEGTSHMNPTLGGKTVKSKSAVRAPAATTAERVSSADRRATIMVCILCVLTMCEHTLIIAEIVYPYFYFNLNNFILYSLGDFFQPFKRLLEFFIFFFFNNNFKKVCKRYLGF